MQIFKNIYFKKRGTLALIIIILYFICTQWTKSSSDYFLVEVSLKHPPMNDSITNKDYFNVCELMCGNGVNGVP